MLKKEGKNHSKHSENSFINKNFIFSQFLITISFIKDPSKFDIRDIIKLFKWHGKYLFHGKLRKTWNYGVLRLG